MMADMGFVLQAVKQIPADLDSLRLSGSGGHLVNRMSVVSIID